MPNADHTLIKHPARIAALRELHLDTGQEPAFDRLTNLAALMTKSPVSLITLVDDDHQTFKSFCGLPESWSRRRGSALSHSFCQHVVASAAPFIVEDARFHPLVEDNPAIHELEFIAYLGMPLTLKSGFTIGTLCVIDHKPRHWSDQDMLILHELTAIALSEIEYRKAIAAPLPREDSPLLPIIEATSDLVWSATMDNQVRALNNATRRFFNITEEDVSSLRVGNFLHAEAFHFLRNEALREADERGTWLGDLYLTRHDGQEVPVSVVILVHHDDSGRPDSWSAIVRDISTLREAENALQKALEEEKRLTRLQGRFINTVSHEFRTPISTVLSSLELLIRHGSRSDPSTHYERMKKGVRDISNILDRAIKLLDDAEEESPAFVTDINLEIFAKEIIASATQGFDGRVIQIELPPNSIVARMDVGAMRSIAEHLLSNALKYSTTGSAVTLKFAMRDCAEKSSHCDLVMYVRDRGIGIPEEDQPFIFERFYRAYNQPNVPGIGAGLYHVKRLVERLDGRIEFYSRVGEGTEFVIIVPIELVSSKPLTQSARKRTSNAPASPSA